MHQPVLLQEVIEYLEVKPGGLYIDATLGEAGYTLQILKAGGKVLAIDWDKKQIQNLESRIQNLKDLKLIVGNFADIEKIARENDFYPVDGIVFDLGLSMRQLSEGGRGLSFKKPDEPLDMRISPDLEITAADLINDLSKEKLYEIFAKNSEEVDSGAIADSVERSRKVRRLEKVVDLIWAIDKAVSFQNEKVYRRIFQALRIEVNHEFDNLKKGLSGALNLLSSDGKILVLSFHSLEDRIVKQFVKERNLKSLTKKPIRDFQRGAKLRIIGF